MKIVVVEFAGYGGMAHYAFQLCRGLSNAGADVTLFTHEDYELPMLCAPFTVVQSIAVRPPRTRRNTPRSILKRIRYFGEWRRLIRRIEALRPDAVILGQLQVAFDLLPLLRLRSRTPVLIDICHRVDDGATDRGVIARANRLYRLFDAIYVHYERNGEAFRRTFDVDPARIGVIAHGNEEIFSELADPTFTAATLRKQLGIGADEKVVLFFGNLAAHKGIDLLLHAFPDVRERTGARLVIAGYPVRGFDVEQSLKLAEELGLRDEVVWVPEYIPSEHVVAWMQLASAIVFPYREDAHGGAVYVAQTYGVPAVGTAAGALQDVIEDGVSGLLVPTGDARALSDAITRIVQDEPLARRFGAQFARDAREKSNWDEIGKTIVDRVRMQR